MKNLLIGLMLMLPTVCAAHNRIVTFTSYDGIVSIQEPTLGIDCSTTCSTVVPDGTTLHLVFTSSIPEYTIYSNYWPVDFASTNVATKEVLVDFSDIVLCDSNPCNVDIWAEGRLMEQQEAYIPVAGALIYEDQPAMYSIPISRRSVIPNSEYFDGKISVDYEVVSNTAMMGVDFEVVGTPDHGTITWEHDDTTPFIINVQPIDDGVSEGNETFYIRLSNPVAVSTPTIPPTLGDNVQIAGTLFDHDEGDTSGGGLGSFDILVVSTLILGLIKRQHGSTE